MVSRFSHPSQELGFSVRRDLRATKHLAPLLPMAYYATTADSFALKVHQAVPKGFVYSSYYPPDTKHCKLLLALEVEPRQEKRGLWGACPR